MKENKYTGGPLLCWDIYMNEINRDKVEIPFGGMHKQSLIDYPGHVSTVIFTIGCNFRCNYCHNQNLVFPDLIANVKKQNNFQLINWLTKNKELLDAVVITGGEPTIHDSLPAFIKRIKSLGLKVKLDTNGTNPDMLKRLINKDGIDYIAMDIKAPLLTKKYKTIVGRDFNSTLMDKIKASVQLLKNGRVPYEFRTTLDKSITRIDVESIIENLNGNYFIQSVRVRGKTHMHDVILSGIQNLKHMNKDININFR